jgi:hypothetical protein
MRQRVGVSKFVAPEVRDQALALQARQACAASTQPGTRVSPPVELHEVQPRHGQAAPANAPRCAARRPHPPAAGRRSRARNSVCTLQRRQALCAALRVEGAVESLHARCRCRRRPPCPALRPRSADLGDRRARVDLAVVAGQLPAAAHDARDAVAGREFEWSRSSRAADGRRLSAGSPAPSGTAVVSRVAEKPAAPAARDAKARRAVRVGAAPPRRPRSSSLFARARGALLGRQQRASSAGQRVHREAPAGREVQQPAGAPSNHSPAPGVALDRRSPRGATTSTRRS